MLRMMAMRSGLALVGTLGLDRFLARQADWRCAVLMMHRVRPARSDRFQPNRHLEITPRFLDLVLYRLRERRIPVVDLDEAARRLAAGVEDRCVVLTLDDGYRDNAAFAAPVMRRHGVPYTVFVATGMIDGTANAWWMALEEMIAASGRLDARPAGSGILDVRSATRKYAAFDTVAGALWRMNERRRDAAIRTMAEAHGIEIRGMLEREMMNWDEIRLLAADPLCDLGGHTVDHVALASLETEAAHAQIAAGIERLAEKTGRRPTTFAYPYGDAVAVSPRDRAITEQSGFAAAVTTAPGLVRAGVDPWAMPRVSLNGFMQTRREFDVLMSGVPFLFDGGLRSLVGTRAAAPRG
jgi:peptidoglycan/xylan/chitin deacetylase (PgdA/CDA1 family)